ncbi:MAG TPA: aryl-sulfate sulfotransferase [Pelobium sp.]|nr:aryl-sulfate sulfotransferase [Pelobium sp.]
MEKIRTALLMFILPFLLTAGCKNKESLNKAHAIFPEEILVSPFPSLFKADFSKGSIVQLNYQGNVVKEKQMSAAALNFKRWNLNGNLYYSYLLCENEPKPLLGFVAGTMVVTDSSLNELKRIRLMGHPDSDDRLDGHEFILVGENHYIIETYFRKVVNNIPESIPHIKNCVVMTPLIQEVKDGKIIFEWDASNFPEFYGASVEGNQFTSSSPQDYMHLNSIFIDPKDDNLLLSFRQTDQVIKINRKSGEIMWRIGGKNSDFNLSEDQKFLRQHDATYTESNTLMLLDNGLEGKRPYSRIIEFALDEESKVVADFKSTVLPDNAFITYMGSVQKQNDVYFIGGGSLPFNFELNATSGALVKRQILSSNSYRAYKY